MQLSMVSFTGFAGVIHIRCKHIYIYIYIYKTANSAVRQLRRALAAFIASYYMLLQQNI